MDLTMFAIDLVAISILTFGIYLPRHPRKDLAVALLGVNIGVLAVTTALANSTVGAGLGLGLFGVLSIIRLRSDELKQTEIAYYFAALAIGLIGGLSAMPVAYGAGLIGAIVLVLALVDAPFMMRNSRQLTITLDRAMADIEEIKGYIERTTGMTVREVSISEIDYVEDSTLVDARCIARKGSGGAQQGGAAQPGAVQAGTMQQGGAAQAGGAHSEIAVAMR